jgi:hypothetical protein
MAAVTTTKLQDYLGRWLVNPTPGTSAATDYIGRKVTAGDHDYLGRGLGFTTPADWVGTHAYTKGTYASSSDNAVLLCTVAGTSGASAPVLPGLGLTVVDGGATWQQVSNPSLAAAWQATHAYTVNVNVALSAAAGEAVGALLVCTHAGTSGASAPAAPGIGNTVVDGGATWEQLATP